MKAARVLFSQQENLRQIMAKPTTGDEEYRYSLFQQLLSAATRPSPIKAVFGRDELEVWYPHNVHKYSQLYQKPYVMSHTV